MSPIFQKLSSPIFWMRSAGSFAASCQIPAESLSDSWIVTQSRPGSKPRTSVTSSHAYGIASSLK